ncbi:MAG: hypothetical protein A3F61_04050 [Candidatus Blackburnbacteria bacterium RIFCSPHIGHO2_12_FULL_41_13b]|uniref:Uncharacterized protein n=1 Tax=Candidatus Blackburnbacteria bacterium RIFCSPHIGHO2_12_FULL_41_13b TaxID=1797517 RepID=A0A1G1VAC3_9BACT|nr:MAG: hypothetical protein A3F61_04050 [Candidatus Blackburnbacteria bacterium RIFCSPHIGHO2_12_FULL_41_13b]
MGQENQIRGLLRRITGRTGLSSADSAGGLVPLSPDQKKSYPYVIYEKGSNSPIDRVLAQATYDAMVVRVVDFPIAVDFECTGSDTRIVVRTAAVKLGDQRAQSALFLGVKEATARRISNGNELPSTTNDYIQKAQAEAGRLVNDFMSSGFYEPFKEYYGGLRWGLDQERFVRALFVHGADYDSSFLDNNLTGGHLSNLTYKLGFSMDYSETSKWYETTPAQIMEKFPNLDYRRLADGGFRNTEEGQKLYSAFRELCGQILAERNKRGSERFIAPDGTEPPRPLIPLARHPVVESLFIDEISLDHPTRKYDFGPSELIGLILDSDSQPAHKRLTETINNRVQNTHRFVFDGPSEFEHKSRLISSVLYAYKSAEDPHRRALLKQDLLDIINGYTNQGVIAESVLEENITGARADYDSPDIHEVKDIVRNIIKIGLMSPDPEIVSRVEALIVQYVPDNSQAIMKPDLFALSRGKIMLTIIDALNEVRLGSSPEVLERVSVRVFGSEAVGTQVRSIVEMAIQSMKLKNTSEVNKALVVWRKFGLSFGDKKDPKEVAARAEFNRQLEPSNQMHAEQHSAKNRLLLSLLTELTKSGLLESGDREIASLFKGLVGRIDFRQYDMKALPGEYCKLVSLANDPAVGESQRSDILWHFNGQFEYTNTDALHLLVPVVLDMFQIALGPVNEIRMPTNATSHAVSAISGLVREHRGMFKAVSQTQLGILAQYGTGVQEHAKRLFSGRMITDGEDDIDNTQTEGLVDWQKGTVRAFRGLIRELKEIEGHYQEYQHIEMVKVFPHEYYPWVLREMRDFWQSMRYEMSYQGREGDITGLYRALDNLIRNRLVIQEQYPEDFDPIEQGHLDELLRIGYDRMIVPHDIKYNSTVWQKGLPFITRVISHMPVSVLQAMIAKHTNTSFGEFLQEEHARRNKEEEVQ